MAAAGEPLRLLCFDGGGVRGLVSLFVLKQCMSWVGNPKPCHFFDMIAGTSTGGLIALMLGRLEMSVEECIKQWVILMSEVFKKKPLMIQMSGRFMARYDEGALEKGIKRIIREAGYDEDELLRDKKRSGSSCKTFVVAISQTTNDATNFTDWEKLGEASNMMNEVTIWQAARATSAATSFFKPVAIMNSGFEVEYIDGALGDNNPINRLWEEAEEEFGPSIASRVRCLVSIGTGQPGHREIGKGPIEIATTIARIAADTEKKHKDFMSNHSELRASKAYWRFNPPDICEYVKLADFEKKDIIATRTDAYGRNLEQRDRYREFASRAKLTEVIAPLSYFSTGDTYAFHQLGGGSDHFVPGAKYWQHFTFKAYKIYERIYVACKDEDGLVHFDDFLSQFRLDASHGYPTRQQVTQVWRRLLQDRLELTDARPYDKGFVLAVLYMLHVEMVSTERPQDEKGNTGVSSKRRELMKRWPNWVPCACDAKCGLTWNFANDIGLHNPPGPLKRPCRVQLCIGAASGSRLAKIFSNTERNQEAYSTTMSRWRRSDMRG